MPIDPDNINTVQVKDLPPNELSLTDNFPHEVGDVLSRSTIQDLVNFLRSQSVSYPYEIKYIYPPNYAYIEDNFDMTPGSTQGLGKVSGIWNGWTIFNGNNGTANLDGRTLIGFGANYATIGQMLGSKDAVVVSHTHTTTPNTNIAIGGGSIVKSRALPETAGVGSAIDVVISSTGESGIDKNIQPSMVALIIMKLP
jgi:hypothetical protein